MPEQLKIDAAELTSSAQALSSKIDAFETGDGLLGRDVSIPGDGIEPFSMEGGDVDEMGISIKSVVVSDLRSFDETNRQLCESVESILKVAEKLPKAFEEFDKLQAQNIEDKAWSVDKTLHEVRRDEHLKNIGLHL